MEGRKQPRWAVAPSSPQLSVRVRSERGCHRCHHRLQRAVCFAAILCLLGLPRKCHQRRSLVLADTQPMLPPLPTPVPTTSKPTAPPSVAVPTTPPPTRSPVTPALSYVPTARHTYQLRGDILVPLSIELYGVCRLGSRATNVFEEGTLAHIANWYNGGGVNGTVVGATSGDVFDVAVETRLIEQEQITVEELRQRQGLDADGGGGGEGGGDGSSAVDGGTGGFDAGGGEDQGGGGPNARDSSMGEVSVVTYVQNITYRTTDNTVTPLDLATDPFSTAAGKEAYMQILKAPSETTVFDDVYNMSDVTLGNLDDLPKRTRAVSYLTMTIFPMRGPMEVTAQAVWATMVNKFMQGYWERALVAGGSTVVSLKMVSLIALQDPPLPQGGPLTLPPLPLPSPHRPGGPRSCPRSVRQPPMRRHCPQRRSPPGNPPTRPARRSTWSTPWS